MSSTRIFQTAPCSASLGFAWQRNLMSNSHTSFREHFSHNEIRQNNAAGRNHMCDAAVLDRNDLGGFAYGHANKQTARPDRLGAYPSWLLSSCLISALTLSEDPGEPRIQLRYLKSNGRLKFCQALVLKKLHFGSLFSQLVNSTVPREKLGLPRRRQGISHAVCSPFAAFCVTTTGGVVA